VRHSGKHAQNIRFQKAAGNFLLRFLESRRFARQLLSNKGPNNQGVVLLISAAANV
jgi:hypothetical protein